jgi:hypothetical protein
MPTSCDRVGRRVRSARSARHAIEVARAATTVRANSETAETIGWSSNG